MASVINEKNFRNSYLNNTFNSTGTALGVLATSAGRTRRDAWGRSGRLFFNQMLRGESNSGEPNNEQ